MLTLPNILTLSRIFAVPLLLWLLWWPHWEFGYGLAFGLYCLMGITDYFDGYLARAQGTVSKLGQFLDPIADKIMVAAVILVLAAQGYMRGPYVGDLHVIAGLIILVREIAVSGLREFLGPLKVSIPVSRLAKWKTTLQLVALTMELVVSAWGAFPLPQDPAVQGPAAIAAHAMFWLATLVTLITGAQYWEQTRKALAS